MRLSAVPRLVRALFACAIVCATALASGATGASTTTVVTAEIPSASTLVNGCTSAAATQFGAVLPDAGARTATGAGVCRLTFGSSNSTSQLRIAQKDGLGAAMGLGIEPPTLLARANQPGRATGVFGGSATMAFGVGRSQTVFRTMNGGLSWGETATPSGTNLDVEMVPGSPNTWWVTGDDRRIWRTPDAGTAITWTSMSPALATAGWPATVDINELAIPDNDTIVVVGESRWIAVHDISAGTWVAFQHADATLGNLVAVDALDPVTFMAIGDTGKVLTTSTKGLNSAAWSVAPHPGAGTDPTDVAWGSSTRAYVVGRTGYAASWDGSAWTDRSADIAAAGDLTGVDSLPGSPDSVIASDEFAVGGGALADWTPDATGVVGECETNGVDPWRAVPATGSLAAHTNAAGLGTVDLVWGFRAKTNQAPGTYEAGIAFEAISP